MSAYGSKRLARPGPRAGPGAASGGLPNAPRGFRGPPGGGRPRRPFGVDGRVDGRAASKRPGRSGPERKPRRNRRRTVGGSPVDGVAIPAAPRRRASAFPLPTPRSDLSRIDRHETYQPSLRNGSPKWGPTAFTPVRDARKTSRRRQFSAFSLVRHLPHWRFPRPWFPWRFPGRARHRAANPGQILA